LLNERTRARGDGRSFELHPQMLVVMNNEAGFTERDVRLLALNMSSPAWHVV
jgi:hypothetical protein